MLADQWALSRPAAIGAWEAWTQSYGDGVTVAVLDSGVQLDHPDLAGNLWTNPGEIAGNGVDDDANGVVDDVNGANIVSGGGDVSDDEGHGTHVAGIIAARAGNGIGGMGLAPKARIMVVKVLDANRAGNASQLARGIRYAVDAGARILNVSLNGDATNDDLDAAVHYASHKGATIVASAGNNGRDLDLRPSYPACSTDPAVISVTASDKGGSLLGFANRGLGSVDIAAPGAEILSTGRGSRYEFRAGTSMAAPYVAGTLALLAAVRPDLSQADLRAALLSSAALRGLEGLLGSGELNAGKAMHAILPTYLWRVAPVAGAASAAPAAVPPARIRLHTGPAVRAGSRATLRWSASDATKVASWLVLLDGVRVARVGADRPRVVRKRIGRAKTHRWTVIGYDGGGARVVSATRRFKVRRAR
jgi:subtilisin family serine protease